MTDEKTPDKPPHLRVVGGAHAPDEDTGDGLYQVFGDEPKPPTPDELIAHMAQAFELLLQQAILFAPHYPRERVPEVAMFLAKEQYLINTEILPRFANPKEPKPNFALRFTTMPTGPGDVATPREGALIETARRLEGVTEPGDACKMVFVYAFLDSVVARGILRMNGFTYEFSFCGREAPRVVL